MAFRSPLFPQRRPRRLVAHPVLAVPWIDQIHAHRDRSQRRSYPWNDKFTVDIITGHACGANVPGHIDVDAFLRQVTRSPAPSAQPKSDAAVPPITLETVAQETYLPERIMTDAQRSSLIIDLKRREKCESMVPSIGPLRHRFSADPSGLRSIRTRQGQDLICDDDAIFHLDWNVENKTWFITKYLPEGNRVYDVGFPDSGKFGGYNGSVVPGSVQSQNGYLKWDYMNQNQSSDDSRISRLIRFQAQEPPMALYAPEPPGVSGLVWAAYAQRVDW